MEGTYIRVRAIAGARKERVERKHNGIYEITVREKAERGKANKLIRTLLAKDLHVPENRLRLITGNTSPAKIFLLVNSTKYHDDKH